MDSFKGYRIATIRRTCHYEETLYIYIYLLKISKLLVPHRNKQAETNFPRIYDLSNTVKASVAIVGLDTTGAFSNSALNFCRFLTQTTPPDPEYAPKLCHLKQALSVAMMQIITEKHQEVMDKYSFMDFEQ